VDPHASAGDRDAETRPAVRPRTCKLPGEEDLRIVTRRDVVWEYSYGSVWSTDTNGRESGG
jgi:hypothetical protein